MASLRARRPPSRARCRRTTSGPQAPAQDRGRAVPEHDPASINVAQQEAQRYSYASSLWPQVSANGQLRGQRRVGLQAGLPAPQKGFFYNVGLNQPIFQWGAYKNNAVIGDLGVKIAGAQYAEAYRLLAIDDQGAVHGPDRQEDNAAKRALQPEDSPGGARKHRQAKFESGAASQAELRASRSAFEQAQLDADRAAEDFAYAKRVFTRLVGIDDLPTRLGSPRDCATRNTRAALADAVLTGFVGDGIESTFQSQVYEMQMKQQDLNYSIAKVRLLPKLSARGQLPSSRTTRTAFSGYRLAGRRAGRRPTASRPAGDIRRVRDPGREAVGARDQALLSSECARPTSTARSTTITYMRHQLGLSSRALSLSEVHNALIGAEVKRHHDDLKLGYASQATIDASTLNLYATEFEHGERPDRLLQPLDRIHLACRDRPGDRQHLPPLCPINPAGPPSGSRCIVALAVLAAVVVGVVLYLRPTAKVETVDQRRGRRTQSPAASTVKEEYSMQMKSEIAGPGAQGGLQPRARDARQGGRRARPPGHRRHPDRDRPGRRTSTTPPRQQDRRRLRGDRTRSRPPSRTSPTPSASSRWARSPTATTRRPAGPWRRSSSSWRSRRSSNEEDLKTDENTLRAKQRATGEDDDHGRPSTGDVSAVLRPPGRPDRPGLADRVPHHDEPARRGEDQRGGLREHQGGPEGHGHLPSLRGVGSTTGPSKKILPTADPETQRHLVDLNITDIEPEKLIPGITGEVTIVVGTRQAKAIIPRRALFNESVYVVKDGRVELRKVKKGYVWLTGRRDHRGAQARRPGHRGGPRQLPRRRARPRRRSCRRTSSSKKK